MIFLSKFCAWIIIQVAWFVTGFHVTWRTPLSDQARIYIANHRSHTDFVLLWAALPKHLRQKTRPVAGADYWGKSPLRKFIACKVFNALLISRGDETMRHQILEQMLACLQRGESLILFPEGTRNLTDDILLPLKSGVYYLVKQMPEIEVVPVWLSNLGRVMPKGAFLPVPLLCAVRFGDPELLCDNDNKSTFLNRLREKLLSLSMNASEAKQ
jgi:1-acyl-sn-glycerol-3-phosphate acyltransferase